MPVLDNPRYENYCQLVVSGHKSSDAYRMAGFKADNGNAYHLNQKPKVKARIHELQEYKISQAIKPYEAPKHTRSYVVDRLITNVERSMKAQAPLDDDGKPIGEFRYDGAVANKALELLGKELGMFIDRKMTLHGNMADMDPDKLRELRSLLAKQVE